MKTTRDHVRFFFCMIAYKNWMPRNTEKMMPELRFALEALAAMGDD